MRRKNRVNLMSLPEHKRKRRRRKTDPLFVPAGGRCGYSIVESKMRYHSRYVVMTPTRKMVQFDNLDKAERYINFKTGGKPYEGHERDGEGYIVG